MLNFIIYIFMSFIIEIKNVSIYFTFITKSWRFCFCVWIWLKKKKGYDKITRYVGCHLSTVLSLSPLPPLVALPSYKTISPHLQILRKKFKERKKVTLMESVESTRLPLSDPRKSEERPQKGSTMTRKGVYAALSYMAASGSIFALL